MIVTPDWEAMDDLSLWHEVRAGTPGAAEEAARRKGTSARR